MEVVSGKHEEEFQNDSQQWKDLPPKWWAFVVGILVLQDGGRRKRIITHTEMILKLCFDKKTICIYDAKWSSHK